MEPLVKGYMVQHTGRFIMEEPSLRSRMPAPLLARIQEQQDAFKPFDWRPRDECIELWRAIAALHDDDESAYQTLVRTGEAAGRYAISSWLKLLLKVLTPRMFARKFPDMFARDHKFGRIEIASVDDHGMVALFKEVDDYDYFAPFAHGFGGFALKSIGVKNMKMRITPFSLANPRAPELRCEASWD